MYVVYLRTLWETDSRQVFKASGEMPGGPFHLRFMEQLWRFAVSLSGFGNVRTVPSRVSLTVQRCCLLDK